MTTKTKQRRKRCSECGELKHDVLGRQKLCEKCEEDKDYCQVCDEWLDRSWGDGCRHVQWSNEIGCCCGCGTTHISMEAHKDSFMLLLAKLTPIEVEFHPEQRLLERMAEEIAANNFWTRWHGPLIGAPPDLEFHYEKDFGTHKSVLSLCDIRYTAQEAWGEEAIEKMQLGMAWLTSLDDKTTEANKLTAYWIRAYLAN